MQKKRGMTVLATAVLVVMCVQTSQADPAFWTDWMSTSSSPSEVYGSLTVGLSTVDVTYSGAYSFAQTGTGTNYWTFPGTYTAHADVDNAPPAAELIALNVGGTKTITFSEAIQDPLIALTSWNTNTVDFGVPIEILSYGQGYWGTGTPILNSDGDGFFGSGEVHFSIPTVTAFSAVVKSTVLFDFPVRTAQSHLLIQVRIGMDSRSVS